MSTDVRTLPEPQTLLGAALFLMTKHAQTNCPSLCHAIAQHLIWLANHPARGIPRQQRALFAKLAVQWGELAPAASPRAPTHCPLTPAASRYLQ